jgi:hypothetical protein
MGEREMLELAARAAGIEFSCFDTKRQALKVAGRPSRWNSLTNDGDALRLAVKLGMWLYIGAPDKHSSTSVTMPEFDNNERHKADPYAATRRAITRAAAEIGKAIAPGAEK